MITILAKLFIKDYGQTGKQEVRLKYGTLSGIVGICFNIILFLIIILIRYMSMIYMEKLPK